MKRFPKQIVARRALAALGAVVLSGSMLLVGALPTSPSASAASSSTFSTTLYTEVSTLNPFLAYFDGETQDVLSMIYPTLTWGNEQNQPSAYLARSWTTSSNKLTWTFHLEPGLKWSDGTPLTASDVAWTYNLIMHNSTAGTANGSLVANFKSVTAPNPTTVVITTTTPQSDMLSLVSTPPIVPEHIWKSKIKSLGTFTNLKTPVVGYGPFTMTGYKTAQYVTLSANKKFFLGAPKYNTVILYYFSNSEGAVSALRSGEVDETDDLTATEWHALQKTSGITTYQTESNAWEAVEVNADARTRSGKHIGDANPLLANSTVREAMAYAINRPELVSKVLGGTASPGSSYLPPAFPEWKWTPPAGSSSTYDPAKANQLLTAAGFPMSKNGYRYDKKTGKELDFTLGIHSDYNSDAQDASYMVGWMKDVGIKLTVQSMSTTDLNNQLAKGDWDLLMDAWATAEDPTYLLSIQTCGVLPLNNGTGGNTDSFFCNKKYDQLYQAEQTQFNTKQREADVDQMEKILYNANYDIILYYNNTISALRTSDAKGYLYGTAGSDGFYPLQNEQLGWIKAIPSAGSSSSSDTGLIIGIVIAVIVVLGGTSIVFVRRRKTAVDRE
jgi:peptide/nickel transport system substrate-binding protein